MRFGTSHRSNRPFRSAVPRRGAIAIAALSLVLGACSSPRSTSQTPESQTAAAPENSAVNSAGTSQPNTVDVVAPKPPQQFELGLFNSDELFEAGSGGCGMALTPAQEVLENGAVPGEMLLFNGVDGSPMLMKINGELVPFTLEEGRGEAFYGQTLSQTFSNKDLNLIAVVDVDLGEEDELESIFIPSGSVQLQSGSETIAIPVEGDAGC